jgi:CheY-like chemotaxis protein
MDAKLWRARLPPVAQDVSMKESKRSVLFVEDHPDTRAMLQFLLEDEGHEVTPAGSLAEAIELAQTRSYDCYLLDQVYPNGSGLTVCRQIRALHPDTPIIFFSAAAHPAEVQEGLDAGANAYLLKPDDILNVARTVEHLIAEAQW